MVNRIVLEPHAEPLEVLRCHLTPQIGDAVRLAVAVIPLVARRLDQLLDDELLRRVRRIAHAEVNHIFAGSPLGVQHPVDAAKQVRRQPRNAFSDLDRKRAARRLGGIDLRHRKLL